MARESSLIRTERHLTNLFVGGAMLFLVIFEMVFIIGRFMSENRFEEDQFREETDRVAQSLERRGEPPPRLARPRLEMNFIVMNASGGMVMSNAGVFSSNIEDLIGSGEISTFENNTIMRKNGRMFRKIMNPASGMTLFFFRNENYQEDDIIRDLLRFLLLDLIILGPLWFMSHRVVRRTLEPVEASIETMSHFVHDAGHELKTPLAVVSGNLQILRDFPEKGEKLIDSSIETMNTMGDSIDGLLTLANIQKPQGNTSIDLKKSIEEEISLMHEAIDAKGITVRTAIPGNLRRAIDREHFHLLMKNLLENAIKYNKHGGIIEICVKKDILSIIDTGIGIPQHEREKIFGRFYRLKKNTEGSGIGLAIVDRIMKIYGWKCEVESVEGEGSTFRVVMG